MTSTKSVTKVFVYGTLRKGFSNHERFLNNSKCLGTYKTSQKYIMHSGGSIPFVSKAPKKVPNDLSDFISMRSKFCKVLGEVYEVDDDTLLSLDRLEGHPTWYRREEIPIEGFGKAWMYIMPKDSKDTSNLNLIRPTPEKVYDWAYEKKRVGTKVF
jgi:gamma-glutamylcyclotransferase (GGCT)/AIG2-like uncharacterized protein YtfP